MTFTQRLHATGLSVVMSLLLAGSTFAQQSENQYETSDAPTPPSQFLSSEQSEQTDKGHQGQGEHKAVVRPRNMQNLSREERRQFYAGFLKGYQMGYLDSKDDVLMLLIQSQQKEQPNHRQDSMAKSRLRSLLRDQMRVATGNQIQQRKEEHVRGQILSTNRITLKNTGEKHLVALVKSRQGKRRIIDLGPTSRYQGIDVEKGRSILAQGRMSHTRDDVPVLLARSVEVDGEFIAINRRVSRQQKSNNSAEDED